MNTLRLTSGDDVLASVLIGTGSDAYARRVPTAFVRAALEAPEDAYIAVQTRRGWERRYIVQRNGQYFTRTAPPKPSEVPRMPVGRRGRKVVTEAPSVLHLIADEVEPPPAPTPKFRLVRDADEAAGHREWCLEAVQEGVFSDDDAIRLLPVENSRKNRWVLSLVRRELVTVAQALRLMK